jgi:hypothetical protein
MLRRVFLALVLLSVTGSPIQSGDGCCHHCGCHRLKKICCPVPDKRIETSYEYTCECEDFCVPGPSKCMGTCCKKDCNGCCQCEKVWQPTCAKVHTRTVLIKKPVTKEVCTVKWVVKTVCCGCGRECGGCCEAACGAAGYAAPACAAPACNDQANAISPLQIPVATTTAADTVKAASASGRLFRQ